MLGPYFCLGKQISGKGSVNKARIPVWVRNGIYYFLLFCSILVEGGGVIFVTPSVAAEEISQIKIVPTGRGFQKLLELLRGESKSGWQLF